MDGSRQAQRVARSPSAISSAKSNFIPSTQGQRWKRVAAQGQDPFVRAVMKTIRMIVLSDLGMVPTHGRDSQISIGFSSLVTMPLPLQPLWALGGRASFR
jgi:hypothetical protein